MMEERTRRLETLILINGAILVGVAIPHLIDDFLFGVPTAFGLTNIQAQILSGIFSMLLVVIFAFVGRSARSGYLGAGILGAFLALAGLLEHVPLMLQPGPYWSGLFSETLIITLILSGLSLSGLSLYAWLGNKQANAKGMQNG
jgi:hypothetical protein